MSKIKKLKVNKPPFSKSVDDLTKGLGYTMPEAINIVKVYYESFKSRNDHRIEQQDNSANTASINLINQFTLLATAVLAFSGAFVGTVNDNLTVEQILVFIILVICELSSLTIAVLDYKYTIKFHNGWSKTYFAIDNEVENKIKNGSLQETAQIILIESKHLKKQKRETNQQLTWIGAFLAIGGAWIFLVLLVIYFFDVPFYTAHFLEAINPHV